MRHIKAGAGWLADRSGVEPVRIFLCGDVMLGRGIDQILPQPCGPELHEDYVTTALDYVRLAERANGPIPRRATLSYVWGAALEDLDRLRPDVRLVNLETSVTRSGNYLPKGINYRMSPENARSLKAASIDCCALANNHMLDWGRAGLLDTIATLKDLGIEFAGAGRNAAEAGEPAVVDRGGKGRVVIYSVASASSGVPFDWAAAPDEAGVSMLPDLSEATARSIARRIARECRPGDVVVVSIHWGANWGYEIPVEQRRFAHVLLDNAPVAIVHGHSSHHAKGIEIYRDRLILYGCGDFLNDYEGIRGREEYRGDLPILYLAEFDASRGKLLALTLVPLQIRRFRLRHPPVEDIDWIVRTIDRESRALGVKVMRDPGRTAQLLASVR